MTDLLDELRAERIKRIANLKAARDLLEQARFQEVATDGMDIFNGCIDSLQTGIDDLVSEVEV